MSFKSQLVRDSWEALPVSEEEVVARFYGLLFESYPEFRALVPAFAPGNLERFTLEALRKVMLHLDDPTELSRRLAPFARRLRQSGIRRVHFAALGETWLRMLAAFHRDKWTGELSRQWSLAFQRTSHALRRPDAEAEVASAG